MIASKMSIIFSSSHFINVHFFDNIVRNASYFLLFSHERVVSRDPRDEGRKSQVANCDTDAIMQVPCPAVTPSAPESVKLTYVHYVRGTVITAEQFDEFRGRRARNVLCRTRKMCAQNVCISMRMMDSWTCSLPSGKLDFSTYILMRIKIICYIGVIIFLYFL